MWANAHLDSYERLVHAMHFAVNDIGMALFFALAAKEVVEATSPGGALHSPRRAGMPLLAAVGGMVGPALIFVGLAVATAQRQLLPGWAVPCATDIAFSYLVARLIFGARHPAIPFLLLLAIADDALGLAILAIFYPTGTLRPIEFIGLLGSRWGSQAYSDVERNRASGLIFWRPASSRGSRSIMAGCIPRSLSCTDHSIRATHPTGSRSVRRRSRTQSADGFRALVESARSGHLAVFWGSSTRA